MLENQRDREKLTRKHFHAPESVEKSVVERWLSVTHSREAVFLYLSYLPLPPVNVAHYTEMPDYYSHPFELLLEALNHRRGWS